MSPRISKILTFVVGVICFYLSAFLLIPLLFVLSLTSSFNITKSNIITEVYAQDKLEEKYKKELRKLQKEIEMLKLKILETKKSLKMFEDMILHGTLTGTKITIYYKNNLEDAEVREISVVLDGFEVSRIRDEEKIEQARKKEIVIYDEAEAIPGKHVVDIIFEIKTKKIFRKTLRYEFDVERGVATVIRVKTQKAKGSKEELLPKDIDITVMMEKVKLIAR